MKTEILKKNTVEKMIKEELHNQGKVMQISASYYEALEEEVKKLLHNLISESIKHTEPGEKRLMKKHIERVVL